MFDSPHGTDTMSIAFIDLVCADPLLLRAEFDALVAASWGSEPPTPPTSTRTLVGVVDPDRGSHWFSLAVKAVGRPRPLRIDAEVNQRSPPA